MNHALILLPDFLLIAIGYVLCRFTALDRTLWQQVERLVYYFLFPVLLFTSITKTPIDFSATAILLQCGLLIGACGIGLSYFLPHVPFLKNHIQPRFHASSAQIAFRFNSFIALAVAERLASSNSSNGNAVQAMAVLLGVCVPMYNVAAVWPMARQDRIPFAKELLRNPMIWGTVMGLLGNALSLTWPEFLAPSMMRIGNTGLALGLMSVGAGLQWSAMLQNKTLTSSVLCIRHLFAPISAAFLVRVFHLTGTNAIVLMAFSGLPTASNCYILAVRMGFDGPYAAALVTLSTLLGMVSVPLALGWL